VFSKIFVIEPKSLSTAVVRCGGEASGSVLFCSVGFREPEAWQDSTETKERRGRTDLRDTRC